jgi:ATP-dependent Clp protease ATP-binding subunit ClpX
VITALHNLDENALVQILTQPRNALKRQYQRLFEFEGVKLDFTDEALTAIARQALERGTGARGLRGVMEGLLRKVMYEMPSIEGASHCLVEEKHVSQELPVVISCENVPESRQTG